jgi:cytochrome c-type biogenesis protein CcsB
MSQATKSINVPLSTAPQFDLKRLGLLNYLPALLPLIGAALMVTARIKFGPKAVPVDGTLIVIAVLCYITAAAALMTNFWASIPFLQKLGVWVASLGFFFNLSSWLIRWVAAGDRENWVRMTNQITGEYHSWWFFSYIPFTNLYDLSCAFAFGAAFATLLISHRPNARFVGAISMPLLALVLILAVFIGNEFIDLPPVLDSYWRPIHVGVASMSYGVALVSFAISVLYLLKDGVKIEAMAVAVAIFILAGLVVFSNAYHPLTLSYNLTPVIPGDNSVMMVRPLRLTVPGVGLWVTAMVVLLAATIGGYLLYLLKNNELGRKIGQYGLRGSLIAQGGALGNLFYGMKTSTNLGAHVETTQLRSLGEWLAGDNASSMSVDQLVQGAQTWLNQTGSLFAFNVKANPVEIAALITGLVATLFVILFGIRTERIRANLPALEKLDNLIYKTVGTAFAGLAILLVTGAVWANESWGRYWGWDAKETGALVAWLAYAGYLHTRIAHGWSGRRSAYFALIGFLLVVFTYLGVSYLLPGLHSYGALGS